jgi:hypothetical protein
LRSAAERLRGIADDALVVFDAAGRRERLFHLVAEERVKTARAAAG